MLRISSKPTLRLGMLLNGADHCSTLPFPFDTGRCLFYYSARYALAAALDVLNLTPDQHILMPAYMCGVEVEPLVRQGVKIEWYNVKLDMSLDEAELLGRIRSDTAAVFVIHYLGFPQRLANIRRICTVKGIVLIEDCAHALLSSDGDVPLGSTGDMAIFSIRKTLPMPDGGCLLINNPALTYIRPETIRPNRFATYYLLSEMLCDSTSDTNYESSLLVRGASLLNLTMARLIRFGLKGMHKALRDKGEYLVYPSGLAFRDEVKDWGMSETSAAILAASDLSPIRIRRRANFLFLLERLGADERVTLPIPSLPDGVCPLLFPVIVPERDRIYRQLKSKGLSGHDWWGDFHPAAPWDDFPEAVYLKKNVFGFPVHQDVTVEDLQIMLGEFYRCL